MNIFLLSKMSLFRGIEAAEMEKLFLCLSPVVKRFAKGESVYRAGDTVSSLGIVLSGSVLIENNDVWGNTSLLDKTGAGQIFAESYVFSQGEPLMVSVVSAENTEILFLNTENLIALCENACPYHNKLIRNLLSIIAQKNLLLSRKIFHTSAKSIRSRLMSYLSYQVLCSGRRDFTIPFNRQQLADYLSVDRSALSNEIGKMQKEGLLKSEKNYFELNLQEKGCTKRLT